MCCVFRVDSLEIQVKRAYEQYKSRETNILKNSFLQSMKGVHFVYTPEVNTDFLKPKTGPYSTHFSRLIL